MSFATPSFIYTEVMTYNFFQQTSFGKSFKCFKGFKMNFKLNFIEYTHKKSNPNPFSLVQKVRKKSYRS